jgi:NitT/TauT family transport system ATP-binding protein
VSPRQSATMRDRPGVASSEPVPALEFRDVSVRFRGTRATSEVLALDRVSLNIPTGSFTAVIGPSGCGKTTLLRLGSGLELPSQGSTYCDGLEVADLNRRVGFITQDSNLYAWMTVLGNVEFALDVRGVPAEERHRRSADYLRMVGLEGFEHHYPHQLSGGMQKRVSIVRTLIYEPDTVLMDEPFGALDSQTRMGLQNDLLKIWSTRRQTILFITHDLTEAISLSDRIVVMSQRPGHIIRTFDIPLPRPRDVFSIQADPGFSQVYNEIWTTLRGEVIASLEPEQQDGGRRSLARSEPAGSGDDSAEAEASSDGKPASAEGQPSAAGRAARGFFSTVNLYRVLMLLGVLGLWEVASDVGVIDPLVFSHPLGVFDTLVHLLKGDPISGGTIYDQIRVTVSEMLTGFAIGSVIGMSLGFLLGRTRILARVLEPFILATYGVPIIAIAPIFILLLGIGYPSKIGIATLTSFFVVFFQTYAGVSTINEEQLQLARIMGASRQRIVRRILIPASLPFIFIGLRQAIPFSMTGAVIGEFIASSSGLGWFIVRASGAFDAAGLFGGLIIMLFIVWFLGQILGLVERRLMQWQPARQRTAGRASIRT